MARSGDIVLRGNGYQEGDNLALREEGDNLALQVAFSLVHLTGSQEIIFELIKLFGDKRVSIGIVVHRPRK